MFPVCSPTLPLPLGEGWGEGTQRLRNHFQHALEVLQHFIVPKPQNPNTFSLKLRSSFIIIDCLGLFRVLPSVYLDRELNIVAVEIKDEVVHRMLAAKLEAQKLPIA